MDFDAVNYRLCPCAPSVGTLAVANDSVPELPLRGLVGFLWLRWGKFFPRAATTGRQSSHAIPERFGV